MDTKLQVSTGFTVILMQHLHIYKKEMDGNKVVFAMEIPELR